METMNENCANDSENTLVQFLIEVCRVLQHQYTDQCTFSRVVAVVAAAGVVTISSSNSIASIPDLTFRHRASCILGQAFHCSPENAFYIFNQQIYFII